MDVATRLVDASGELLEERDVPTAEARAVITRVKAGVARTHALEVGLRGVLVDAMTYDLRDVSILTGHEKGVSCNLSAATLRHA